MTWQTNRAQSGPGILTLLLLWALAAYLLPWMVAPNASMTLQAWDPGGMDQSCIRRSGARLPP